MATANKQTCYEACNVAFQNVKHFSGTKDWILPPIGDTFQTNSFFVRADLHELRQNLDKHVSKPGIGGKVEWRDHIKKLSVFGPLIRRLRDEAKLDLVTESWPKLWEILHRFQVTPERPKPVRSFHLCEIPGSFVCALNQFVRQDDKKSCELNWWATSLNPHYEGNPSKSCLVDDRFMCRTGEHWTFGPDGTGDIFRYQFAEHVREQCGQGFDLITADGSVDNDYSPVSQETSCNQLVYTEVFVTLKLLQNGGSFVLRVFSIFECYTLNLIYLLNCCFEHVSLIKPVASYDTTSELYVVCRNYRYGHEPDKYKSFHVYLTELQKKNVQNVEKKKATMFSASAIPKSFLSQVFAHMKFYVVLQIEAFQSIMAAHPRKTKKSKFNNIMFMKYILADKFLQRYPIGKLEFSHRIFSYRMELNVEKFRLAPVFTGEYLDPVKRVGMSSYDKSTFYRDEFVGIEDSIRWRDYYPRADEQIILNDTFEEPAEVTAILAINCETTRGKACKDICVSPFVNMDLFAYWVDMHRSRDPWNPNQDPIDKAKRYSNGFSTIKFHTIPMMNDLVLHEALLIKHIFYSIETKVNELCIDYALLMGQKVVGLLFLIAHVLAGQKKAQIMLQSSGTIRLNDILPMRKELLELRPVFDSITECDEDELPILGVVSMMKMRNNTRFFDAIKMHNNLMILGLYKTMILPRLFEEMGFGRPDTGFVDFVSSPAPKHRSIHRKPKRDNNF